MKAKLFRNVFLPASISLLFFGSLAFAQADDLRASKFDEFDDIYASDLIARLDNLAIQLQNAPDTKAFLVVYRARRDLPGLSNRYAQRMKSYLIRSRGISPEQVVTVDGGVASSLVQELWIVPPGTTPQPRADVSLSSYYPAVYKFDEHRYADDGTQYYWGDSHEELLEGFAVELQKNVKATGYLVAYRDASRGASRAVQNTLRNERNILIKEYGIQPARIKTIAGGYRGSFVTELWISQEAGATPTITSYRYRPKKRRR
ncbi:MAG TPA: hypothetical protein VGN90_02935 [Pyrinomonadaceae bacterium]|jgi:hypothetical protein|nr:hypothetical protein [Pyrinomonadaceae bacterium]